LKEHTTINYKSNYSEKISFSSSPTNAYFFLNGVILGVTPFELDDLQDGEYNFEIRHENMERVFKLIEINKRISRNYFIDIGGFLPDAKTLINENNESNSYEVTFNTNPSGAYIFIDGLFIDKTPFMLNNMQKGTHSIELRRENKESQTKTIIINSNRKQTFNFDY